jgi:hypothetical protein
LLVEGDPEHPRIKLAAPGLPQKALTNVRFRGNRDMALRQRAGFPLIAMTEDMVTAGFASRRRPFVPVVLGSKQSYRCDLVLG